MSGTVLTITSGKGGVGKTTTTASLSVALARMGKWVVCIDADIGLRSLDAALGVNNRITNDLVDVVEGRARLEHVLVQDPRLPNLMLLPASKERDQSAVNEYQMVKLCNELKTNFDFIMIDCPAGIETGFQTAITPADQIIVVVTPEVSSVRGADHVVNLIEGINKPIPRLIVNRLRPKLTYQGDMFDIDGILDILAIELIGIVPEDESAIAAGNKGRPLTWNIRSPAAAAFTRIARRLLGENVPFMDYSPPANLMDRFSKLLGL
jgi:septum site-determining protein MinD